MERALEWDSDIGEVWAELGLVLAAQGEKEVRSVVRVTVSCDSLAFN